MLADLWPLLDLRLITPRLVLRYPSETELADLAAVAAAGVHLPGERPYLTPWTEGSPQQTAQHVVQQHRRRRAWDPDGWVLELGVFRGARPVGMVALRGHNFSVSREVKTESWLGLPHHRQAFGTEARTALLHLAFTELGACAALSEAFRDNAASLGVSRRLGYRPDGTSHDLRDGQTVLSDRLRLDRADWVAKDHAQVDVAGFPPAT